MTMSQPTAVTEPMRIIIERKVARRKQLAALPVGEKLRMLVEMRDAAEQIAATRLPKPTNPIRL